MPKTRPLSQPALVLSLGDSCGRAVLRFQRRVLQLAALLSGSLALGGSFPQMARAVGVLLGVLLGVLIQHRQTHLGVLIQHRQRSLGVLY